MYEYSYKIVESGVRLCVMHEADGHSSGQQTGCVVGMMYGMLKAAAILYHSQRQAALLIALLININNTAISKVQHLHLHP